MRSNAELKVMLKQILSMPKENEWIEFKHNNMVPEEVEERISALSNNACLHNQNYAYLVFGVEDETLDIIGTNKHFGEQKKGNEELEHWILQRLNPKIDFRVYDFYAMGKKVSIIQIPAAVAQPVRFLHKSYVRIGSITRKLDNFPDKERKIWQSTP